MKKMFIMRGLPGSGKSFLAKTISKENNAKIFSTDDFFMMDGKYNWNPGKLPAAHQWNQKRVEDEAISGFNMVIDNTNLSKRDIKPYAEIAAKYGYEMEFVESNSSWALDPEELAQKNSHGVPLDTIKKMIGRFDRKLRPEDMK